MKLKPSDLIQSTGQRTVREIDRDYFEKLLKMGCKMSQVYAFFGVSDKTLERWIRRTYGSRENFSHLRDMFGVECFISNRMLLIDRAKMDTKACIYLDEKLDAKYGDSDVSQTNQLADAIRIAGRSILANESDVERYASAKREEEESEDEE